MRNWGSILGWEEVKVVPRKQVTLERQPLHSEVLSKNLPAVFIDQRTCPRAVPPIAVSKVVLLRETLFLYSRPSPRCVQGLGIFPFDLFSLSKVTADHLPQFCFSHICAGWRDPSLYIEPRVLLTSL